MQASPASGETTAAGVTKAVLTLIGSLAWPCVFIVLLLTQKKKLAEALDAFVVLLRSAKKLSISKLIDLEVDKSAEEAKQKQPSSEVPKDELEAASRVQGFVTNSELPMIKRRMLQFAHEYESVRSNMERGSERTRAMNAIVAKMRTLAIAAKPFLQEFCADRESPGARLAGICVLQLSPNPEYLDWLVDRMKLEQPFVFFHASIALLALSRSYGSIQRQRLLSGLNDALTTVQSFEGGRPDENTVRNLETAIKELGGVRSMKG